MIATAPGATARELLAGATGQIAAAGCGTPRLDAEILLADALGLGRGRLLSDPELVPGDDALALFRGYVRRRADEREPVAYIVGRRAFRRIELAADRRALVPRPETELLVECALGLPQSSRVLDVGTGSGAVALALKHERPDLDVSGCDVSRGALELARDNSVRLGLDVRWLRSDLLEGLNECIDAVLANLPYVPLGERDNLAPEILEHEPPEALFAGPDGLTMIHALLRQLARRERIRFAALEVGDGQAHEVEALMKASGFSPIRRERDLAGVERVLVGEGRI
jgi:release factor glutamine methyltransferase